MSTTRPAPTAVLLRRWLCAWLALLLLAQMLGSTMAGLHGTWHRHRPAADSAVAPPSTPIVRWRYGETTAATDAHTLMHERGESHDHVASDSSVLPFGLDSAGDAVGQLAAALAPSADAPRPVPSGARHVRPSSGLWVATSRSIAPPHEPPRG